MLSKLKGDWTQKSVLGSKDYKCGYCDKLVASKEGYFIISGTDQHGHSIPSYIYICPGCNMPSFFHYNGHQMPSVKEGVTVSNIPSPDINSIYEEARNCMSVEAYTAAVLCCRKLLMHIAVEKGASPGKSFLDYIEYLSAKGYIPPDGKSWVDHIRTKGNDANHEIIIMNRDDATNLIIFSEMLLKFIYEFPGKITKSS